MTREEMNSLKPGDTVRMREFPHNDVGNQGQMATWEVEHTYPADLSMSSHVSRIMAMRPGSNDTMHRQFVAHYHAELVR